MIASPVGISASITYHLGNKDNTFNQAVVLQKEMIENYKFTMKKKVDLQLSQNPTRYQLSYAPLPPPYFLYLYLHLKFLECFKSQASCFDVLISQSFPLYIPFPHMSQPFITDIIPTKVPKNFVHTYESEQ